jgi:signal transduction histidine kinase
VAALVLLVLVVLTVLDYYRARGVVERLVTARAEQVARRVEALVPAETHARRQQLLELGRSDDFTRLLQAPGPGGPGRDVHDLETDPSLIDLWLPLSARFFWVELLDTAGARVAVLGPAPEPGTVEGRPIDLVPLPAAEDRLAGVIRAAPRIEGVLPEGPARTLGSTSQLVLLDRARNSLVAARGVPEPGRRGDPRPLLERMTVVTDGAPEHVTYGTGLARRAGVLVHLDDPPWSVFAAGSLADYGWPVGRMWLPDAVAILLGLTVVAGGATLASRGKLRRLHARAATEGGRRAVVGSMLASLAPPASAPGAKTRAGSTARSGTKARTRSRARSRLSEPEIEVELSHELRNPLGSLRLSLDRLARAADRGRMPAEARRPVAVALREVRRLEATLGQALSASASPDRAGARAALRATAAEVGETLAAALEAAEVRLELPEPGPDVWVPLPSGALAGIVMNLVLNALEASPAGGTIRIVIGASARRPGWVSLTVEDEGAGVPAAMARAVFTSGYTTRPGGSGLGLAVSRQAAESAGGRLELEGAGSAGARFVLELPRTHPEEVDP